MPKRDNRARAATGARGRCGATRGGASGAAHMGEHRNQPPPNASCHRPSEVTAGWLHTSTTGHNWRSQCNPAPNRSWAQRNFYRSGLSRGGVVAAVATVAGSLTKVPKAVAVEVKAQGKPGTGGMPGLHRTAQDSVGANRYPPCGEDQRTRDEAGRFQSPRVLEGADGVVPWLFTQTMQDRHRHRHRCNTPSRLRTMRRMPLLEYRRAVHCVRVAGAKTSPQLEQGLCAQAFGAAARAWAY